MSDFLNAKSSATALSVDLDNQEMVEVHDEFSDEDNE